MMANKLKKSLLLVLSVTSLGLVGCNDVEAGLTGSAETAPILNFGDDSSIYNNNLKEIYEALVKSGDSNSEKVLNTILLKYAQGLFGDFYSKDGKIGIYEAATDESKQEAYFKQQSTKAFKDKTEAVEFAKHIKELVQKEFWAAVKNSSYQKYNVFEEDKFYDAQVKNLYELGPKPVNRETKIDGSATFENVGEYFAEGYMDTYADYVNRSVLPGIYRKALVKRYLLDTNKGVLGRSYARKVQYIALPDISGKAMATQNLVRSYAKEVLENASAPEEAKNLHFLDKLYQGTAIQTAATAELKALAKTIYTAAGWTTVTVANAIDSANTKVVPVLGENDNDSTDDYYVESTYGAVVKDYLDLSDNRNITGSSTDFTNSGAYTKEIGLEIKRREAVAASKVTEGWYTSSGLSGLQSDVKTRLFKISVANEVDSLTKEARKGSFVWNVQGSYYMVPETLEKTEEYPYCIYDKDSSTWYICRVDEAVKASKLSDDEDSSAFRYDEAKRDEISWTVADLLGDTDSYKSAARQNYVKEMAISYNDQKVYDYFKSTFPDLFD